MIFPLTCRYTDKSIKIISSSIYFYFSIEKLRNIISSNWKISEMLKNKATWTSTWTLTKVNSRIYLKITTTAFLPGSSFRLYFCLSLLGGAPQLISLHHLCQNQLMQLNFLVKNLLLNFLQLVLFMLLIRLIILLLMVLIEKAISLHINILILKPQQLGELL